jgi:tetratricopeptide (TPR) repeat protein
MRSRSVRSILFALSFALLGGVASPALAQGKKPPAKTDPRLAEAKKLFDEGAAAYAQGNYEEAIRAWEKSFEISQKPLIFESIANAWERLGDARKAKDYLAKWRDAAPAEERDLLDARIRNLDGRVQREEEAAKKAAEDKARREAQEKADAETKRSRAWLPGAVLTGVGGAAVLAGLVIDIVAKTKRPGADACKTVGTDTFCKASAADAIKSSNTLALAGDALWIGGAAVAATGAVLLLVLRPSTPRDASAPTAWIAPMPGGAMLGGTF